MVRHRAGFSARPARSSMRTIAPARWGRWATAMSARPTSSAQALHSPRPLNSSFISRSREQAAPIALSAPLHPQPWRCPSGCRRA
eukprot:985948-Pyramimonas_sp.AAC.1